ncbi:MAG TPA: glycosyltransferase family 4 protein [Polyangiales bacterium]|nr:glycosyltransferase family 4 protein [Polyangiales bacterium]
MNILMLNHNVIWRSTFFRAFYFARELASRGHRVTVATISRDRLFTPRVSEIENVKIVETPDLGVSLARTGWDPWDSLFRAAYFQRERFDIVHGFDCRPVVLAPSLLLRFGGSARWVSDWADWWGRGGAISERKSWIGRVAFAPLETFLEERFRWIASQVTVTSHALYERCLALNLRKDRVHYIPSGANVRTIRVRDRAGCRQALQLPLAAPIACFVGFVQYDLELVVRAFAVVHAQLPAARLVLVGPPHKAARELVQQLGLADAVIDVGAQPFAAVESYLGAADVLLMPMSDNLMNRARGPIKLGDYMAAGRPIVANPVGDMVDIFQADDIGVLAPDAPEAYGGAITQLLSDPARSQRLGANARRAAEKRYAWSRYAPQLEAVYDRARAGF